MTVLFFGSLFACSAWTAVVSPSLTASERDPIDRQLAQADDAEEAPLDVASLSDDEILSKWKSLLEQRQEMAGKLVELELEFKKADLDGKKSIQKKYTDLIKNFEQKVRPDLLALAEKVADLNPEDSEAIEIALALAWEKNQYQKVADWAQKLYDAGHKTKPVLNYGGVAHFALQNFETAKTWLDEANAELLLDPNLGERYLGDAADYIEFWKAEQAIREQEANAPAGEELPRVLFKTDKGDVEIELFENEAPNTVANFISLVESKAYDGTTFHRVIPNFMVQGGDPNSKDTDPSNDGGGGPGYTIPCECYGENARKHFTGSLSMAHRGKDTGGSQFFITHLPTPHLNVNREEESGHTVFGRVVEGMDVVWQIEKKDQITEATVLRKRDHEYKPLKTDE